MSAKALLRGVSLALLVVLAALNPLAASNRVEAQTTLIESSLANGTLIVDTEFYTVRLNTSVRGVLEDVVLKGVDGRVDVFDPGAPSFLSPLISVVGSGGEVLEINLSDAEWEIGVLENTSNLLVASLTPSLEGYNVSLDVNVIVSFRASLPYFTYLLAMRNSGDEALSISGPRGSVAVSVGFNNIEGNVTFAAYTVAGGYRPVVFENESLIKWVFGETQSSLLAIAPGEDAEFIVFTRPVYPLPSTALGEAGGNSSSITVFYPNMTLNALETRTLSLDIGYVPADPIPLALAGLGDAMERLGGNFSAAIEYLISLPERVEEMNATIRNLEETLESLRSQVDNLTETLERYQGIEDFYKSDVKRYQDLANRFREELRGSNQRMIAAATAGIILGFIGGIIARRRY
ncbi:MAG: hypothetical protein LRS43_04015 [Desulfurococcales archaeon]|nr:hypothetical protein [Desulfurococcales archaeon]